jgi:serine dehydrogenase proteinase
MPTWSDILLELQQLQQAPGSLPPGWSPFDFVRRKYITQLHQLTTRNVVVYASKWTQGPVADAETISITAEDIQGFMEVVHGLPPENNLDLILHLPGGSAEVTEAIVKYLRSRFSDIRVFVPQAAMSAASMLSCASNRIVMGSHSFLGPIDPQFVMRTDAGVILAPAHAILEQFRMAQKQCQDPKLLPSWLPILRMYGPSLIVECQLATKLSRSLVTDWLAAYMLSAKSKPKVVAARIAKALAAHAHFMSHSRFISRDQAKKIGLVVDDLEANQGVQDAVLSIFHAFTHTFNATPAVKIIENQLSKAFIKLEQRMNVMLPMPAFIPPQIPPMMPPMVPPGAFPMPGPMLPGPIPVPTPPPVPPAAPAPPVPTGEEATPGQSPPTS